VDTLLPGIGAERVPTSRLTVNVLSVPGRTGLPVLFVHGNVSSSLFWQPGAPRPAAATARWPSTMRLTARTWTSRSASSPN